ncbi:hypothetical protein ILUMI_10328 [Ignelater luminosus]|uniref:Peptidase M14 domain-containing protein n=1 Tax=Ignelater luminosus TaxID=2038154 RepID=A0A8K0G8T3_IGNLU|nr:hypothetical protein ILUMI_10328 [Ignelater luminosus]
MDINPFEFLHFIIFFLDNCLCRNFFTDPLQKIKAEIPKTQWKFLQYEFSTNHLDIHRFRYQAQSIVIEAGASVLGEEALENANIPFSITEIDLHEAVKNDLNQTINNPGIVNGSITFQRTLRYDEILNFLKEVPKRSTSYRYISVEAIGKSFENRDIQMVKIQHPAAKSIMFFDAGIHGREWISVMTALYLIVRLIEADRNDDINDVNWYIIPCVNPDGFIYSHEQFPFQRGNRNVTDCPPPCSVCGVDLNRNFGYKWGVDGLTSNNCSLTNPGSHAFSEPESKALANTLEKYAKDIQLYISMHSYGCDFLLPWTYEEKPCDDADDLNKAADRSAALMNSFKASPQCRFDVQTAGIMPNAGSSEDYAKGALNIKYVYTLELQSGGQSGFYPLEREIQDSVLQSYAGIKDITHYIHTETGRNQEMGRRMLEQSRRKSGCREIYSVNLSLYILFCFISALS